MPGFGDLVTKIELARFSRTLGTLLRNGVSPLAALAITQGTIGNSVLRAALGTVMESAKEGKGIAEPLEKTGVVPGARGAIDACRRRDCAARRNAAEDRRDL